MVSSIVPEAAPTPDLAQVHDEFRELLSGCGVYDLSSRAKISLTGGDRVRWLNGMVTNNIRDLAVGRGVYAFLLNPQGRILGDLYAYNRGDSITVDTDQAPVGKVTGYLRSLHHHGRRGGFQTQRTRDDRDSRA